MGRRAESHCQGWARAAVLILKPPRRYLLFCSPEEAIGRVREQRNTSEKGSRTRFAPPGYDYPYAFQSLNKNCWG